MRSIPSLVLLPLLLAVTPPGAAQPAWSADRNLACGATHACLTDAELAGLVGKQLAFRHPRAGFGDVVLELRRDGTLAARHAQATGGTGPYRFEGGLLVAQLPRWGETRFQFVRLGRDQLAVHLVRHGAMLVPVAVKELDAR